MSLDLDQIRSRLASMDGCDLTPKYLGWDDWYDCFCECGPFTISTNDRVQIPPSAVFVSNAPTDIAALLAEVERLRAENEGLRAELKTTRSNLDYVKEDRRQIQVTLDNLRYRIERRDIYQRNNF